MRWRRRPGVVLGGVASVAFGLAFAEGRWLFPLGSINHDEPMYTFAARLLRTGHLSLPATFTPYRPWASGVQSGHLVLKYKPPWPGVLAAAGAVGSMRLGVAVVAAAAIALTGLLGRELFGRWTEGVIAAAMLVLSPLFLVQEGTYLSYLFQLTLDLAIVLLVLGALRRWPERGPAPRTAVVRLVAGGAVWGIAAFAREYDAVLIAAPLVVMAIGIGWRTPRRAGAWVGWSALGAAAPLAMLFAYNWAMLGSPLRNSLSITGPYDTLLFGRRGVFPSSSFRFTAREAAVSFVRNLTDLPSWLFGGVVLVVLAGIGLWRSRRRGPAPWAVAGIAVSFAVGYALFWSPYAIVARWPGAQTMGPFYSLALLIPLTLFGAAGLAAIIDRNRAVGIVVVVAMISVTAFGFPTLVDRNRRITRDYEAAKRVVDRVRLTNAVLFTEDRGPLGFESAEPFFENRPDLRQPVVYATGDGRTELWVMRTLIGRTPYRLRSELRPGDELLHPTPFIERLHLRTAATIKLRFSIVNTVGASTVTTRFRTAGVDRSVVLATHSQPGTKYTVEWTLTAGPRSRQLPFTTVAPLSSSGVVEVEADFSDPGHAAERYELRYPYAITGRKATVIAPGWGRYLFQVGNPIWLNERVSPTLAELP